MRFRRNISEKPPLSSFSPFPEPIRPETYRDFQETRSLGRISLSRRGVRETNPRGITQLQRASNDLSREAAPLRGPVCPHLTWTGGATRPVERRKLPLT